MSEKSDFYKNLIDNLFDGIYFVDRERTITYWNKGAERITGYEADRVLGRSCRDNILNHVTANGVQLCLTNCPLAASMEDGKPREAEVFLHHAQGHRLPVVVRASPIFDDDGNVIGAVETFSNNGALFSSRERIRELKKAAFTDPLTEVGNRRYLEARLQSASFDLKRHGDLGGILFIDIDGFKGFNDTYGHDIGDKILKVVAQTLKINLRSTDVLGRWGGEEFVVILHDVQNIQAVREIGEKLRVLVEHSNIEHDGKILSVTISIGGTLLEGENFIEENIQRADKLMYQSKQAGRNRVTVG